MQDTDNLYVCVAQLAEAGTTAQPRHLDPHVMGCRKTEQQPCSSGLRAPVKFVKHKVQARMFQSEWMTDRRQDGQKVASAVTVCPGQAGYEELWPAVVTTHGQADWHTLTHKDTQMSALCTCALVGLDGQQRQDIDPVMRAIGSLQGVQSSE